MKYADILARVEEIQREARKGLHGNARELRLSLYRELLRSIASDLNECGECGAAGQAATALMAEQTEVLHTHV